MSAANNQGAGASPPLGASPFKPGDLVRFGWYSDAQGDARIVLADGDDEPTKKQRREVKRWRRGGVSNFEVDIVVQATRIDAPDGLEEFEFVSANHVGRPQHAYTWKSFYAFLAAQSQRLKAEREARERVLAEWQRQNPGKSEGDYLNEAFAALVAEPDELDELAAELQAKGGAK